MPESGEIKFKPPEDLKFQAELAGSIVQQDKEQNTAIVPPSNDTDEIFSLSTDELREKFPRRYGIYLNILRKTKGLRATEEEMKQLFPLSLRALQMVKIVLTVLECLVISCLPVADHFH